MFTVFLIPVGIPFILFKLNKKKQAVIYIAILFVIGIIVYGICYFFGIPFEGLIQ